MFRTDLGQGQNLGGAHDRRIHAGFAAVVQEDGIEHDPRRRRQTEAHIADPEHHVHPGQIAANASDRLHGGRSIEAVLLDACGDRQGEGVVEDLVGGNPELEGIAIGPLGDGKLALRRSRHALLIDGAHHHTGAVGLGELQHLEEAFIAVFVVGGVEDALAPGHLEAGLHLLPLRGVEHQRQVDVGDQTAHQLMHVPLAIATDVVDVDVEHVGVLLHLAPGHGHQAIPVFFGQELAHLLAATGIETLANDQEGVVLVIRRGAVDRGG